MDPKTMVQAPAGENPVRPVARDASTPIEDDYHTIASSKSEQMETYSKRASALESALGNKDSVKG